MERAMMTIFMMTAAPFSILLGFVALCLGMEKHYKEYFPPPASRRRLRLLRAVGWLLLALALAACVIAHGGQIGPLMWVAWLSVLGMAFVFARPWLARD
jgi:Na+/proline symporter